MRKTTPEDNILFACTRQNFLDTHRQTVQDICCREEIDWAVVYSTANLHGVAPLVYFNLKQCHLSTLNIPQNILRQFRLNLYHNVTSQERNSERLADALIFFERKSIEVMLVKGVALDAVVYDHPWFTVSQDIDIVTKARREEVPEETQSEIFNLFDNSDIECDYFEHHDIVMNGTLSVDFHRIWAEANKIKIGNQTAWVMSPEDMLISLCINSCRKRYFRLKALCDIAETVNKYSHLKWQELIEKAEAYDCQAIVYTALFVTRLTLGCQVPDKVLENFKVGPLRAKIIHFLSWRLPLSTFSSFFSSNYKLGRPLDISLVLPYCTYRWYQMGRRLKFVYRFTRKEKLKTKTV